MVKKRIIVKGNVQDVNYRIQVRMRARALGIKGFIRNLDDGTVEIFCESDTTTIKRFLKEIEMGQDGDPDGPKVTGVEVFDETENGYGTAKAPGAFKDFDIEYSTDKKHLERENIRRQEMLVYHGYKLRSEMRNEFGKLGQKVDGVGRNVNELGEKIDVVGQHVIGMHGDMNEKFMTMEKKYHTINKNIERSNKNIELLIKGNTRTNKSLESMSRALVKLIQKDIIERRKVRKTKKK